ncbi:MAG TPA: flavin reductase family protein, partial [Phenylobacterium sp.]|nr:flavin reductase family protein [Phenylobacterium sp.]
MSGPVVLDEATAAEPVDPAGWKMAMGAFASGVVIVTTLDEGRPVGTTVSAFSSVSLHPPLLLVCLDEKSRTLAAVRRTGNFCINILAEGQEDLARLFAGAGATDRFRDVVIEPGLLGAPMIGGALGNIDCRLHALPRAGG